MELMEIILLIAGGLIFILSFFIPDGKNSSGGKNALSEDEMNTLLAKELTAIRGHVDDMVQEAVGDAMDKTERSLEKLSNEKIMAVNEYSDTVLAEIHKNHDEVLFLYDMLNNKHVSIKDALGEINSAVKDAKRAAESLERLIAGGESGMEGFSEQSQEGGKSPSELENCAELETGYGAVPTEKLQDMTEKVPFLAEGTESERETEGAERNNNVRILKLYRQGKSVMDIAKELSLGVGEVKLVVDLFKNQ